MAGGARNSSVPVFLVRDLKAVIDQQIARFRMALLAGYIRDMPANDRRLDSTLLVLIDKIDRLDFAFKHVHHAGHDVTFFAGYALVGGFPPGRIVDTHFMARNTEDRTIGQLQADSAKHGHNHDDQERDEGEETDRAAQKEPHAPAPGIRQPGANPRAQAHLFHLLGELPQIILRRWIIRR